MDLVDVVEPKPHLGVRRHFKQQSVECRDCLLVRLNQVFVYDQCEKFAQDDFLPLVEQDSHHLQEFDRQVLIDFQSIYSPCFCRG